MELIKLLFINIHKWRTNFLKCIEYVNLNVNIRWISIKNLK